MISDEVLYSRAEGTYILPMTPYMKALGMYATLEFFNSQPGGCPIRESNDSNQTIFVKLMQPETSVYRMIELQQSGGNDERVS